MNEPPQKLDYQAKPPLLKDRDHLVPLMIPPALGIVICLLNLVGIVAEGGESFLAPGLGLISLLVFVGGAVPAGLSWRLRKRWAGRITLVNLGGIVLSIVLSCAGLPRR